MSKVAKPLYSYTQLSAFEQCQYSWYLLYQQHAKRESNAFSSYGSLVHELLEQCAKGEIAQDALADLFDWQFDEAIREKFPPNKYVDLRQSYHKQGVAFFAGFEGFDGMDILGVEEHFVLDRGDYALQGYIDLIYRQKDQLICRDWKSAKAWSKQELADHAKQVYLYSAHCKEKYGQYPDLLEFFHFREGNKKSVIVFSEKDYQNALDWADAVVEKINCTWDYRHNYDDFFCSHLCSCRSSCPYRVNERKKFFAAKRK